MAEIPTLTGTFKALQYESADVNLPEGDKRSKAQRIIEAAVFEAAAAVQLTIDKSLAETDCLGWGKLATSIDKVLAEAVGFGWGKHG